MKRIAVIGSGISGLSAAWALRNTADITLYEKRSRLGGHAHTMSIAYDETTTINVDGGFIVYNSHNYPNLISLFEALGVETQPSDMSFSVSDPNGWEWASTGKGFFAQKKNLLSPKFHRFWRTILRFNDQARAELAANAVGPLSLGDWLRDRGFDEDFRQNYILPMGAAIWSTPEAEMLDYPALSFLKFFDNHRLMHKERPKWRTVKGGSQNYVAAISKQLEGRFKLSCGVKEVRPFDTKTVVVSEDGRQDAYDDVILATHSDQALDMLGPGYQKQKGFLKSIKYRANSIYVHRDTRLMPGRRSAWASWNVLKQSNGEICLTYWMNRLQSIDDSKPVFITLNPEEPPADDLTFDQYEFDHPQFDLASEAAVRSLKRIQGHNGLWFCGAWMGSGFHEDGLRSGLSVATALGGRVPWSAVGLDDYAGGERVLHEHKSVRAKQL